MSRVRKVSFVVPVLNNKVRLEQCLKAIRGQEAEIPIEIIVVDNGSSDGSAELAAGIADQVAREVTVRSPYACRNRGIAMASGDLVVLLDSNVVLGDSDWVARAVSAQDSLSFDVGVPKFEFDFHDSLRPSVAEFHSSIRHQDSERDVAQGGASGACLLCDRVVFDKVGLFPTQRSNSDSVWTRSVSDARGKLVYVPTLVCRYPAKNETQQMRTELRIGYGNRQRWLGSGQGRAFIALRSIKSMLPESPVSLRKLVERRAGDLPQHVPFLRLWMFAWKMRWFRGLGRIGVRQVGKIAAD